MWMHYRPIDIINLEYACPLCLFRDVPNYYMAIIFNLVLLIGSIDSRPMQELWFSLPCHQRPYGTSISDGSIVTLIHKSSHNNLHTVRGLDKLSHLTECQDSPIKHEIAIIQLALWHSIALQTPRCLQAIRLNVDCKYNPKLFATRSKAQNNSKIPFLIHLLENVLIHSLVTLTSVFYKQRQTESPSTSNEFFGITQHNFLFTQFHCQQRRSNLLMSNFLLTTYCTTWLFLSPGHHNIVLRFIPKVTGLYLSPGHLHLFPCVSLELHLTAQYRLSGAPSLQTGLASPFSTMLDWHTRTTYICPPMTLLLTIDLRQYASGSYAPDAAMLRLLNVWKPC